MPEINSNSVYIIGVGACTAIGADAASAAAAARAGIAGFSEHPGTVDTAGKKVIVAMAPYLPPDIAYVERFSQLALPAARQALNVLSAAAAGASPIPVIVGLPPRRPGLPANLSPHLSESFARQMGQGFELTDIKTIDTGHAAGLMALETGWGLIRSGNAEFCLIGGIDSYIAPETLQWLEECEQLHSAGEFNNAWGFVPGEAAGFCLLASEKMLREYRIKALARVISASTSIEKNLIKTEAVCLGEGLTAALKETLLGLPGPEDKIDETICDMNGEDYRAAEFGFASLRVSEGFVDIADFIAPADCWGDVGAASGPLFVNLAISAWLKHYAKGPHALLWASSEGGERSAMILRER